jgi:hypothetical protein
MHEQIYRLQLDDEIGYPNNLIMCRIYSGDMNLNVFFFENSNLNWRGRFFTSIVHSRHVTNTGRSTSLSALIW